MGPGRARSRTGAGGKLALAALTLVAAFALPAASLARPTAEPWPPPDGPGELFVQFGEEHVNDADGPTLPPKVVRESARYRPRLVTMSGDKADNGELEQFELWSDVMAIYDRKDVPWFAGVGNHDRDSGLLPGGTNLLGDCGPYRAFFADRPYPMGDERGYRGAGIRPRTRNAADPVRRSFLVGVRR